MQPSIGVADLASVQNAGRSTPGAGDFLLMLPSNDVYIPAIPDCDIDILVNNSYDMEDDHVDSCNKALSSSGICRFGDANGDELAAIVAGRK